MDITEIEFIPVKPHNGHVGFVSFVFNGQFYFSSVAVYVSRSGSGYFLVYPKRQVGRTGFHYFNPITKEVGNSIESAVNEHLLEIL
jgi:hypothetical protein